MLYWLTLERKLFILHFGVTRSMSNHWSSSQHCPLNNLWTIGLIIAKLGTVVASGECIIHCIKTLLNFAPGGHRFLLSLTFFSVYVHPPPWKKNHIFSLFSTCRLRRVTQIQRPPFYSIWDRNVSILIYSALITNHRIFDSLF